MDKKFTLALVTGASSGIGEAVARLLAEKGIDLIIHGRDGDSLDRIAEELSKKVQVDIVKADLAVVSERKKVIDIIHQRVPDLVVNNAGFGLFGDALTFETKQLMQMLEVNGNAVLEMTLEAARSLISAGKKGVIMNVSSSASEFPPVTPGLSVYCASKSFVSFFSQSFDAEVSPYGVRVLASCPGLIGTNFRSRAGGKEESSFSQKNIVMTPEYAADQIWKQIQNGKPLHVFDRKTKFLAFILRNFFPKKWVAKIYHKNILKRAPNREIIKNK